MGNLSFKLTIFYSEGRELAYGSIKVESVMKTDPPESDFIVEENQGGLTIEFDESKYPLANITIKEKNNLSIISPGS